MMPHNNHHQGTATDTTILRKGLSYTFAPKATPQAQVQAHVNYSSSLGKPGPIRTSNSLNRQRQPISRPIHPPQQQEQPHQRPPPTNMNHAVDSYIPDSSRISSSSSYSCHQRINSTGARHMDEENDRLQSLFRKARSQSMVHHNQGRQQDRPRSVSVERNPVASPTEYRSSIELHASTRVRAHKSTESIDSTSDHTRLELLQYLKIQAEQTRQRLQAIEQLERDINAQQDSDSDPADKSLDELISAYLSESPSPPSPPSVNRCIDSHLASCLSSSQTTQQISTRKHSGIATVQSHQPSTFQYRYLDSSLPPPLQQQQQQKQQQHSAYTTATTKSKKPSGLGSRRQSYGVLNRVPSPPSPCSSLSPPISPLSPVIGDGLQETNRVHQSFSSAAFHIHAQSKQHQGWRPELEYGGQSGQHEESLYGDDDSEDSLLYEHFDGQQEDLRDVTLSDMMKRHLAMLSDNESDTSLHGSDQVVSGELQAESECESNDLHLADMTFADRTFQFMSKLELDFDSVAQDSPSLLTETIPENSFGDMTFIIYPTETAESTTRAVETTTARNHIQSNQQDRNQQSSHLPTENVQKESILDEFLKTLPPLPKSPDSKRLPPNVQTRSAVTTTLFRASNSPPSRGGGRTVPLPAPIITSRERCRQIMRERSNAPSDQKRAAQQQYRQSSLKYSKSVTSILGESSSPFTSASPLSSTPWSNVTAPLTSQGTSCLNLPSETSSSSSVYDSAKEEFSPDFSFKVEDINEIGSKVGSTNISPVSINRKTSNAIATPTQLTTKSSPSKLVSFRHPPLDMIIICPTRVTQASGKSSPWPPLVSATSMASDNSSSWSWSWPSYKLQSRANSSMVSFQHQQPQVKGIRARIPSTLDSPPGVNIKSRSMSSLIKHQNGWLGFQLLDVRLIASGRCHIVVVTQSNQVYSCWETNNDKGGDILPDESNGQEIEETLGRSTKAQVATTFIQNTTCQPGLVQIQDDSSISWPSNIIKIVCSDNATFVLTECGDLWGWGFFEDMSGKRIGLLNQRNTSRPIQICAKRIKDVVCGRNHILILNSSGDVISWGANEHGQLGRPCSSTKPTPSQGPSRGSSQDQTSSFDLSPYFIESLPPCMIGIGAGKLSSFAWDEERLYGWGDNTFGQLGRGPTLGAKFCRMQNQSKDIIANSSPVHNSERRDIVSIPREVPLHWKGRSLKQIQGGERHTIVLTLSGLVIAMGNDDFGQLGITSSASTPSAASPITTVSLSTPTSSSSSSPLTSQSSSETSAWFNSGSSSYAANNSSERSLAEFAATITKPKTRLFPALVRIGAGVKEIRCGDFHTVTCSDNGQMFAWGRGYDGILAIHNLQNNQEQVTLPSGRNVERGMELSNTTKVTTMSLIERTRRVAAISTMGSGVSIALVSND